MFNLKYERMRDFSVKITKRTLLHEMNNSMCHNFYFLVNGHIRNSDDTRYRKFRFVVWFELDDVAEFYDLYKVGKADVMNYLDECISCNVDTISSYDNVSCFYDFCRESIEHWNELVRANEYFRKSPHNLFV